MARAGADHNPPEGRGEVVEALEQGIVLARRMPYPYAEARLPHVYGTLHAQKGEPALARQRLGEALTLFLWLGARKDAEGVEQGISRLAQ